MKVFNINTSNKSLRKGSTECTKDVWPPVELNYRSDDDKLWNSNIVGYHTHSQARRMQRYSLSVGASDLPAAA